MMSLYLGVSTKTIDRMVAAGELESYKVGRLRRFDRSALDAYLDRQRHKAAEERERRGKLRTATSGDETKAEQRAAQ